jgi:predicted amidohydrolase YtcJ
VRVVGGFTEHQFAEKRLPTIEELNAVAPDTPVFLLHLYDRALINEAALRAVGYTKDTPDPPAGEIVRDGGGNPTGLLLAKPNVGILYATLARGPKLPFDCRVNSTRHFMRELNRLGVTGAIDAGGGFQNYPEDYAVIKKLADEGQLTVRIAYNFEHRRGQERRTAVAGGFRGCHRLYPARRRIPGRHGFFRVAGRICARRLYGCCHVARAPLLASPRSGVPARIDDQPGACGDCRGAALALPPRFPG